MISIEQAEQLDTLCSYVHHANEIHQLVVKDYYRAGADAFLAWMEHILSREGNRENPVQIVIDSTTGILPMTYIFGRMQQILHRHPRLAPVHLAFVVKDSPLVSLLENFRAQAQTHNLIVHYFSPDQWEDAVGWLLD